ncbi:MAG: 2-dehydropantoate 2-reductase [Paracoccaceae bacterium]
MKICIYGAGAIGGYLGAKLARTDADVSLVARGPHLTAIRKGGLTLIEAGQSHTQQITATDTPATLGVQDYVIVTLKAHSIPAIVSQMQPLLGPETTVVFAVNGVPWWYFYGLDGKFADHHLKTVDPGGEIWNGIGPERALGCVVYPACEVIKPGVVAHKSGNRFSLGEPDGTRSARAQTLSALMVTAGLKAPVRPRLRDEIWLKLWGNASLNPISALTGLTLKQMLENPETSCIINDIMAELKVVGEALGARFGVSVEKRMAGAAAVGEHKTSMLQDLEAGREMEIDALVSAVKELAILADCPTPTLDRVLAQVVQKARAAGCYPN